MRKIYITVGLFMFMLFAVGRVFAQTTEPGLGLPLLDYSSTATTTTSSGTTGAFTSVATSRTSVSTTQQAVDDADTGTEMIVLVILSITGGIGIFLIKKYFDFKRYSL